VNLHQNRKKIEDQIKSTQIIPLLFVYPIRLI